MAHWSANVRRLLAVILIAATLSSCSDVSTDSELFVSAASSLTDAFSDIEKGFESAHAGVHIVLNLGGSSSLREQILQGAPADVFAPADTDTMDEVVEAGLVAGQPRVFATNRLQIVVPPGNPAGITGLADFDRGELFLGLCAVGVPCGDLARIALERAGVAPAEDSDEPDVRSLLTKVEAGELDAGIVYVSDVVAAGRLVEGIEIPPELNVSNDYPIAAIGDGDDPGLASSFMEFVLSDEGRAILTGRGFAAP